MSGIFSVGGYTTADERALLGRDLNAWEWSGGLCGVIWAGWYGGDGGTALGKESVATAFSLSPQRAPLGGSGSPLVWWPRRGRPER